MAFGLGPEGFKRKRYADIIANMETRAKTLFGEDVNLTVRSPLGIFIMLISWCLSIIWELAEKVYLSAYKDDAEGAQLDKVAKNIGLARKQSEKARFTNSGAPAFVKLTGLQGSAFPSGSKVATTTGIEFETTENAIINATGQAYPKIQAILPGVIGNVDPDAITVIVNPAVGIESVINTEAITGGRDKETDAEFKARYDKSVAKGGSSTIPSIEASLLETNGVRAAVVVENKTMDVDSEGRPPKSISCYVLGGLATDIAKTILETKAGGIQAFGTTIETVKDNAGNEHQIGFSFAEPVDIYVKATLKTNAKYPTDGDAKAKLEVIKYIGGQDDDGNTYNGMSMGDTVVQFKAATAMNNVPGIDDAIIELSTDGINYSKDNITIPKTKVAQSDTAKVVINHA